MKITNKQDDIEILKMLMVIQSFQEKLVTMIAKRLPIKKEQAWNYLYDRMSNQNDELTGFIEEASQSLENTYGAKHVGKASQMAQAEYDKMIVEEQFYRDTIAIAGKGIEVQFMIDEESNQLRIISISEPIQEKHLARIKNELLAKCKLDKAELCLLKPLNTNDINKIKHSVIKDLSGSEWILNGASVITEETKVSISKSEVITSEDLTRNFTLKGEQIGKWEPVQ